MPKCWWCVQVARASSRLVNAVLGGEGDTTFSAYSYELKLRGSMWGYIRVWFVDSILGKGHCLDGWEWHQERNLFEIEK
jgi:hypothetical protein